MKFVQTHAIPFFIEFRRSKFCLFISSLLLNLLHAVENVLEEFRESFIKSIKASAVVQELQHADIISDGDVKDIRQANDATQQSTLLHTILVAKCTVEALMKVCDIIISVKGNPRMKEIGKKMKKRLESKCLCVTECLHAGNRDWV